MSGTPLLLKSQLRFLARNPIGTAATLLGIALAVTSVVTVHLTGKTLASAVRDTEAFAGYSHVVTRPNLSEEHYFDLRLRWRQGEWPELAGLLPMVEGTVRIGGEHRRLVGIEPLADIGHSESALGRSGEEPAAAAVPALLERFLVEDVVATSERIVHAGRRHGDVPDGVALLALAQGSVLLADLPTAWGLLERPGQLDAIWLRTDAAPELAENLWGWLEALLPGLSAALDPPPGPRMEGYVVTPAANWQGLGRYADAVVFNLGALGALALLVAAFWRRKWQSPASGVASARYSGCWRLASPGVCLPHCR